jgi:hypothetical protein
VPPTTVKKQKHKTCPTSRKIAEASSADTGIIENMLNENENENEN